MLSIIDQLKGALLGGDEVSGVGTESLSPTNLSEAQAYVERVNAKIDHLAGEFASGEINRAQFQELFDHYQRERRTIQTWSDTRSASDDWKEAVTEGHSIMIRRQHKARVLGYAIYENESGVPLSTIGHFEVDPALAVPMMSSYRTAAREIFGGDVRSTQIDGGKWLTFIPGQKTTLMAIFTTEPARQQLKSLEDLHELFEKANIHMLARAQINAHELVFPHHSFLGRID